MMGITSCPSCQVKPGGMVSIKLLSIDSRKRSVVKGSELLPVAFTKKLLASKGMASAIKGCAFISSMSVLLKLWLLPMFSLVMILVTEI